METRKRSSPAFLWKNANDCNEGTVFMFSKVSLCPKFGQENRPLVLKVSLYLKSEKENRPNFLICCGFEILLKKSTRKFNGFVTMTATHTTVSIKNVIIKNATLH